MTEHAKFSPSAAHRWISCPGSIRMSENIESKTSDYALEGTVLHKLTETCLREKSPASELIGTAGESLLDGFNPDEKQEWVMAVDEDHAYAVQYCVDEVKRITKEYGIKGGKLEVKVELTDDCWGTVDVLLYNDEILIAIDFKFGRGKSVEAEGNAQLMIYYLGAVKYLIGLGKTAPPKAMLIILQPRIPNPTRVWETTFEEIKTWYIKSVKPAIEEAKNGDAPCNPGEEQCQFCPANGVCTARSDYLLGVAEQEFKPYVVEDKNLPVVREAAVTTDLLTPEKAAHILSYQKDFDNFFKRVGEYALNHALSGGDVPGYKLVYGKSNRKWSKGDDIIALILTDMGVEPHGKPKLISPAQAEKKLGKAKGDIADYIYKPTGKTILVDESDSREPVDISGEEDMAEFVEAKVETVTKEQSEISIFDDTSSIDDIMSEPELEPELDCEEKTLVGKNSSIPNKTTKKYQVLMRGLEGGASLKDAAEDLFKGNRVNLSKALKNLNTRDGFTIIFHTNNTFTVKEAV